MNIEFLPWEDIPQWAKREVDGERQVYGITFMGEPAWLPWMGDES